ncbi:hypothetical protein C5C36_05600 [Rathayibacter sp. AY1G1]|uniref:hypothetical protein n=1 Tax=unclassified Rathayibacter TaxID=2609250 RepID=UPI000CE8A6C1|nr:MULTISPECIES: hypothetical protein [unclassified Rathayibacter]PPG54366.1 hypothetical protein C5C41_04450 [Rathayibacter sp. AY1E9]PPG61142.1 hypothetical protein C5C57_03480 [Rathayibacter sp. AY1C5]PPH14363.1 hypothetical protein C5C36_05600 [Rathayibacter sp. AY1G1]PPH19416.1 hypothetical protein C5C35_01530 [Rathayibacter sp. AY1F8]PPH31471.1 hypothetical protein C5C37_03025 [Rathayibacter sp. AY1F9]
MRTSTPSPHPSEPLAPAVDPHEHGWTTESAHRTSEGVVVYVRCVGCGTRRVDVRTGHQDPPAALSRVLPASDHRSRGGAASGRGRMRA